MTPWLWLMSALVLAFAALPLLHTIWRCVYGDLSMPRLDITTQTTAHEVKAAVCACPYCGRPIRSSQRLSYPPAAVGAFAPVYHCRCGKHVGGPTKGKE